ncbi:solute carrier family 46 member 3-like [Arapaima gigas]
MDQYTNCNDLNFTATHFETDILQIFTGQQCRESTTDHEKQERNVDRHDRWEKTPSGSPVLVSPCPLQNPLLVVSDGYSVPEQVQLCTNRQDEWGEDAALRTCRTEDFRCLPPVAWGDRAVFLNKHRAEMRRLHLIEPVVGVFAFAMFMTYPVVQQYVYRRLWEQLTGAPYPHEMNISHCAVDNSTLSRQHEEVQREASLFFLYSELCILLPSLVISLPLVSYSDHRGRKVAIIPPLVGELVFAFTYTLVSHFSLSLKFLFGAAFVSGLLGGPVSLVGGCFAYVADRCGQAESGGKKTVRMAVLDMILGVLSGLASLCSGFFIQQAGFTWPFLTAGLLHLLNLAYVLCILEETVVVPSVPAPCSELCQQSHLEDLRGRFQGVYLLFATSTHQRSILLSITLLAFGFYKVANLGGMSIFILYELNMPLCWSEVLVGYGSALSAAMYMVSFAGVYLLSLCLRDAHIALLGLLSVAAGLLMAAFAKTTLLMFLVRVPLLLSIMPAPVLRSMMSKIVLCSEQGAMFACVAFVEMLSMGVAFTVFSSTYAASVSWFSGFSFLLASGLTLIPLILISSILCLHLDVTEETQGLTREEVDFAQETLQISSWDPR